MNSFASLDADIERLNQLNLSARELLALRIGLRTRHNALTALCRLPHEVLAQVLQDLAQSSWQPLSPEAATRYGQVHEQRHSGWRTVMRVCTYVRAVALASPTLWTTVFSNGDNYRWPYLCADRSRAHPLAFAFVHPPLHGREPSIISPHFPPRIQDLRLFLVCDDPATHDRVRDLLDQLRSLVYFVGQPRLPVAFELAAGASPALPLLTELVLSHVALEVGGVSFPNLVRLELQFASVRSRAYMRSVLAGMPLLRFLCLDVWFSAEWGVDTPAPPVARIHLPHLQTLMLKCKAHQMLELILALPTPRKAFHVDMELRGIDAEQRVLAEVLSMIGGTPCIDVHSGGRIALSHAGVNAHDIHLCATYGTWVSRDAQAALAGVSRVRLHQATHRLLVSPSDGPMGAVVLPAVEHLELHDAWFPDVTVTLITWLRARAVAGLPVHAVNFLGTDPMQPTDLERLRVLSNTLLVTQITSVVLHEGCPVSVHGLDQMETASTWYVDSVNIGDLSKSPLGWLDIVSYHGRLVPIFDLDRIDSAGRDLSPNMNDVVAKNPWKRLKQWTKRRTQRG
jgi:hypothetical protein